MPSYQWLAIGSADIVDDGSEVTDGTLPTGQFDRIFCVSKSCSPIMYWCGLVQLSIALPMGLRYSHCHLTTAVKKSYT